MSAPVQAVDHFTQRRCARLLALLVAACALGFQAAHGAPAERCEPAAQVTRIAPGIHVRPGKHHVVFEGDEAANVGFIIGERCVAVLDTGGSYEEGQALGCAIRRLTALPVCYVINTHVHPDHLLGNLAFAGEGVEFVGHAKLPRALALRGEIYLERAAAAAGHALGAEKLVAPGRTVDEELRLDLGARTLIVSAHPSAHTDNDLSVYDVDTGTLWLSDLLFVEHVPVIDASINGWLRELERLTGLSAKRVVPGHGPPSLPWPSAAEGTRRYLTLVREQTRAFVASGASLREAQEQVGYTEAQNWQLFEDYHKRNVATAYAELEWE